MNITRADYSNLRQSTAVQSYIKQNRTNNVINAISSVANAATAIIGIKQEQDKAQLSNLDPVLKQKVQNLDSMIQESVTNGTSTLGDDGQVRLSQDIQDYIATWGDDIDSDENLSANVKKSASEYLTSYGRAANDYALGLINKQNQVTLGANIQTTLNEAVNVSAQQGSSEYLLSQIKAVSNGNASTEAYYTAMYMPQYQTEQWTVDVDRIAAEEGYASASDYIDGLASAPAETKTTLKKRAANAVAEHESYVTDQTKRSAMQMLQDGYSWADIGKTLTDGLSEYDKSLVQPLVLQMQTADVTPQLNAAMSKVIAGNATDDDLNEAKTWLNDNRYQFEGGCEALWETYMAKVDKSYTPKTSISSSDYKHTVNSWYNEYNAGRMTGNELMNNIDSLSAVCDDVDAIEEMTSIISKVAKQKIPTAYQEEFDRQMSFFTNFQFDRMGVSKLADMDAEELAEYNSLYEWMSSSVINWMNSNTDLTDQAIDDFFASVQNTFTAKYLDTESNLEWGVDSAGTKSKSFLDTLAEYENSVPVYMENGKLRWYSEEARTQFDNAGRYGIQALNAAGYNMESFSPLMIGDQVYPLMVFTSKEGNQYAINENGDVCEFVVQNGKIYKGSPITPQGAEEKEIRSFASKVPHNYVFEFTEDILNAQSGGSSNFTAQQKALQAAADEEAAIEAEETRASNDEQFAHRNDDLTSTQTAYRDEIMADLGVDINVATEMAPKVDALIVSGMNYYDAIKQVQAEMNGETPANEQTPTSEAEPVKMTDDGITEEVNTKARPILSNLFEDSISREDALPYLEDTVKYMEELISNGTSRSKAEEMATEYIKDLISNKGNEIPKSMAVPQRENYENKTITEEIEKWFYQGSAYSTGLTRGIDWEKLMKAPRSKVKEIMTAHLGKRLADLFMEDFDNYIEEH